MVYVGSKNRIFNNFKHLIEEHIDENTIYIEPFVGGCNSMDKITATNKKIGCDNNEYLIAMWKALQDGWEPPTEISEEEYKEIKNNKNSFPDALVGYTGFVYGYCGKWFDTYCGNYKKRNYPKEKRNNILKQLKLVLNVNFINISYEKIKYQDIKKAVFYCDPPYKGLNHYKDEFDHDKFWSWVKEVSKMHKIFVSEYEAPLNFTSIWQQELKLYMGVSKENKRRPKSEKLFIPKV